LDNSEINQEPICGVDGQFEIRVAYIEVEEAVFGAIEVEKFTAIATPSHAAAEGDNFRKRGDPIGCAMEENHRWKFSADELSGAQPGADFFRWKTLRVLTFRRGVNQGAK
jgi:hypothetical protein